MTTKYPQLVRVVLSLAGVALALHLIEQIWNFSLRLGSLVSILAGAWYLSVLARPLIGLLGQLRVPRRLLNILQPKIGSHAVARIGAMRLPFGIPVAISYLALLVVIIGIVGIGATSIIPQVVDLVNRAPDIYATLPMRLVEVSGNIAASLNLDVVAIDQLIRSQNISGQISQVATILGQQLLLFLTGVGSFLTQLLLSIILSIYITMEGRQLRDDFFKVLPKAAHETATAAITQITRAFEGYLRGALLAAAIEGAMCFMALTVFRVNYALPTAALYFVVNLVPLVGSPLGMITVFLVTLFANPAALLWVMVTLVCSNLINAYVITPRVMSGAVGVPSILALLSTTVGVQLFGFWGLIFGTPVTGAAYAFVMNFLVPRARGELVHESAEVGPATSPVSEPRPTSTPHSQIAHSSKN